MKTHTLKLGSTIYSFNSKILEYKVIEIQYLETEKHKEKFFILECTACRGHTACKIATKINNSGNLEYSHMINNYSEDEDSHEHWKNSEYYWHTGDCFFLTRTEARLHVMNKNIAYYNSNIHKAKETIEYNQKFIAEEEEKIKGLNDSVKELAEENQ